MKKEEKPLSYKKISNRELLSIWNETNITNNLHVYVHNPFCKKFCSYCVYMGRKYNINDYKRYYHEYLPNVIDIYREIIEKKDIVSWFFGGGTPSLIKPNDLRKLLDYLPKINQGEKVFEIHSADISSLDIIDILGEYNFSGVILGIQTFDQDVLKEQNRNTVNFKRIQEIVRRIKKNKLNLYIDLIPNLGGTNNKIFNKDLQKAFSLDPEEISISPLFSILQMNITNIRESYYNIFEIILNNISNEYIFESDIDSDWIEQNKSLNYITNKHIDRNVKVIRIFKKSLRDKYRKTFFSFLESINDKLNPNGVNTLGLGSGDDVSTQTFSTIYNSFNRKGRIVVECNEDWKPAFYTIYEKNLSKEAYRLIDKIFNELGEPPCDINIMIHGNVLYKKENNYNIRSKFNVASSPIEIQYQDYNPNCNCFSCKYYRDFYKIIDNFYL